jgi:hypothetical protein
MTANQLYKQSGSDLTFKEWLKETQNKGILDNHERMFNMIDSEEEEQEKEMESNSVTTKTAPTKSSVTTKTAKTNMGMMNFVGLVGLGLLIYGLSKANSN